MVKSKTKVEQSAITKFRDLIDKIKFFKSDFAEVDKGISWDGSIELYNGNIDRKDNYDYTIDVQIKGRTTPSKKLGSKQRFSVEKKDLENYLKKGGTLLLLCTFLDGSDEYKLYFASLLPYEIRKLLNQFSGSKIKVGLDEIKSSSHFEFICRNFKLDKEAQKKIDDNVFNEDSVFSREGKVSKFYLWNGDYENFTPQSLLGMHKYVYTIDESGHTINVSYGEFVNVVESLNAVIQDKNHEIIYEDVKLLSNLNCQKVIFGKAFSYNFKEKKFHINICGSFRERIKQLKFIKSLFLNNGFFVNDMFFSINSNNEVEDKFNAILDDYIVLDEFLKSRNIFGDYDFDKWSDSDFSKLSFWICAINENKPIQLNSEIGLIGSIKIQDMRLSIIAIKRNEEGFIVDSIWNNNGKRNYQFKYVSGDKEICTNNIFLMLNSEAYYSDDINYEEMKSSFENSKLTDDEYCVMNLQLLEILKVYDETKNKDLLVYAKFLSQLLVEHEHSFIYYINYCQVLKRANMLLEEHINKLIEIRDLSDEVDIKLGCNLLIDNKLEAKLLLKRLDSTYVEIFKKYPIALYL